jgi:ribonuclease HI
VGDDLYSVGLEYATNNYAELFAVYQALEVTPVNSVVLIVTDSKLVRGWLALNWNMKVETIRQIVSDILAIKQAKNIKWAFKVVKGHSTNEKNNIVDRAASNAALQGI